MENVNNNNENINRHKPLLILVSFKNYKVKFYYFLSTRSIHGKGICSSAKCTMFTSLECSSIAELMFFIVTKNGPLNKILCHFIICRFLLQFFIQTNCNLYAKSILKCISCFQLHSKTV